MEHDRKLNGKENITYQRSVERERSIFEYKEQAINSYLEEEDFDQDNNHAIS
jgi:hypothetical protein